MITKEYLQQELAKRIDGYKSGVETSTDKIIAEMKSILVLVDALNDYENAYKAVLKTATQWIKDGCTDKEKICLECVFPELRESEDERIRKWLLECIENLSEKYFVEVNRQDVFAYLEKQKEQKLAPDDLQKSFEAGQTSIVDNPEKYGLCKAAEWSEEDERRIDAICELLENTSAIHPNYSHRKLIIWLKSLRPSWKPSEEQMEALYYASYGGELSPDEYFLLTSLYEQLKNL